MSKDRLHWMKNSNYSIMIMKKKSIIIQAKYILINLLLIKIERVFKENLNLFNSHMMRKKLPKWQKNLKKNLLIMKKYKESIIIFVEKVHFLAMLVKVFDLLILFQRE